LAADEIEVQAAARDDRHVAERDGVVVELDTTLTPELLLAGDIRELTRAIQEARKVAGMVVSDRAVVEIFGGAGELSARHGEIAHAVGAESVTFHASTGPAHAVSVPISSGEVGVVVRRVGA
jgi:Tfp pilus assembly ATPase PilU